MRRLPLALALLLAVPVLAGDDAAALSSEAFLARARRPPGGETWALLQGQVEHRRRDQETIDAPLRVALRFYPQRAVASVRIGAVERYNVGQPFNETEATITRSGDAAASLLGKFGLRPEDLTLTFLFWKYQRELAPATAGGRDCRVFELLDPVEKETAKVYIALEAFFPIKVEWVRKGETEPYRTLEIKSLKLVNDIYTPKDINIFGPGWRSRVSFGDNSAGRVKDGVPKDLFEQ